ncbi:MAG: hypothetical protein WAV04_03795 [Candidatus Microsaccharimonas sp.]|jgi:hypothetical protein
MSSDQKSPLHASALRLRDITPGRRIVVFNVAKGVRSRYTVTGRPVIQKIWLMDNESRSIMIPIGGFGEGVDFATDLGLVPYPPSVLDGGWNPYVFSIDARKEHLLPRPDLDRLSDRHRELGGWPTSGRFDAFAAMVGGD